MIELVDRPLDHCGLFGVFGSPDAAASTFYGLYALQHRGQESAGIAAVRDGRIIGHRGMGLVGEVFRPEDIEGLKTHAAIGHVRYSTAGSSHLSNAQPLIVNCAKGLIAIAHNGNLVNARHLRDEYEAYGSIFQTTTDSEIVVHILASQKTRTLREGLFRALNEIRGPFHCCFSPRRK